MTVSSSHCCEEALEYSEVQLRIKDVAIEIRIKDVAVQNHVEKLGLVFNSKIITEEPLDNVNRQ